MFLKVMSINLVLSLLFFSLASFNSFASENQGNPETIERRRERERESEY